MRANILTVLKSGGEYGPEHVHRLADQVAEQGYSLMALSDMPVNVPHYPPDPFFPSWWSKLSLFRLPGPILYMDLDTTVVGDLEPFLDAAESHDFIALRDFYRGGDSMGSGLMAWSGDVSHVWNAFMQEPNVIMGAYRTQARWGDQAFIQHHMPNRAYWQDIAPEMVFSYKVDCGEGVPAGARVVCFHGRPRPWDLKRELTA